MPLLKMTQANGLALNIPAHAIRSIESLGPGLVPDLPSATMLIRYDLGLGLRHAHLKGEFVRTLDEAKGLEPAISLWPELQAWRDNQGKDIIDLFLTSPLFFVACEAVDPDLPENNGALSVATFRFSDARPIAVAFYDSAEEITDLFEKAMQPKPLGSGPSGKQPPRKTRRAAPKR